MSKKFLAALLAVLMVISMVPMTAFAEPAESEAQIGAAPLGTNTALGGYEGFATAYGATAATVEGKTTITVTAEGLKYHQTSDKTRTGFFVGVAIPTAGADATYATGWGAVPASIEDSAYKAENRDNTISANGEVTHDTFYFDIANAYKPAQGQDTGKQGIVGEGASAKVQGYVSVKPKTGEAKTYIVDMTGVKLAAPELTLAFDSKKEDAIKTFIEMAKKLLYPDTLLKEPDDGIDRDTIFAGIFNADPAVGTYAIQVSVPGENGSVAAKGNKDLTVEMPNGRGVSYFTLNPSDAPNGTWLYTGNGSVPTQSTDTNIFKIKAGQYKVQLGTMNAETKAFTALTPAVEKTITIGEVKAVVSDDADAATVENSSVFFDATEANTKIEYTLPTKPASAPTGKDGYKFVGWKNKDTTDTKVYEPGAKATVPAGTVFYADWSNEVLLDAGFSWTYDAANAATGKTDCMDQTMWMKLNEGANGSYVIEVLKDSTSFYTDTMTISEATTAITYPRWSYLHNGRDPQMATDKFVEPGSYTINLYRGKVDNGNVVKDTTGDNDGLLGTKSITIPAFPAADYGLNVTFADTTATVTTEKPLYGRYYIELLKGQEKVASTYTEVVAGTTTADSLKSFTFTDAKIVQGADYTVNVYECNRFTAENYTPGPKAGGTVRLTKTATYTAANDVTLKSVTVNGTAATAGAGNTYTASVANSVTEAEIVATATNSGATVTVAKKAADVDPLTTGSGTLTAADLEVGSGNVYTITVTADEATETYELTITRQSSGGGGGGGTTTPTTPPSPTPTPTPEPPKATVEPVVDDNSATGTVGGDTISDLITEAGNKDAGEVVVEVKPSSAPGVDTVKAELPAESMKDLADAKVDLTVSTPVADVTLPQETLKELGAGTGAVTVTAAQTDTSTTEAPGTKIEVTVEQGGKAVEAGVTATVPANVVSNMAGYDKATVTVSTPVADVVLPNSTLVAAGKNDVSVSAAPTANGTAIEVKKNGVTMTDTIVQVSVPVPETSDDNTVAYIVDASGNKTIMPKSVAADGEMNVLLNTGKATITYQNNAKTFSDSVSVPGWAKSSFTTSRELIKGIDNGNGGLAFRPNKTTTRAELVTMLHRLENEPNVGNVNFDDMKGNEWYKDAAAWAQTKNVVNGTDKGFEGNKTITRQELATMLYRYMNNVTGYKGKTGDYTSIAGGDKVNSWAADAMRWAYGSGIITGKASGGSVNLDPTGPASRAEVSAMLERFVKLIAA